MARRGHTNGDRLIADGRANGYVNGSIHNFEFISIVGDGIKLLYGNRVISFAYAINGKFDLTEGGEFDERDYMGFIEWLNAKVN
jgi:hypothetical protein